jgi:ribosomal protein S18 acetylase RimI-like enzyme
MAPFSAIAEPSIQAYADLARDLPAGAEARLFRPKEEPSFPGWQTLSSRPIIQMVMDDAARIRTSSAFDELHILDASNSEDMLQLVQLTKPGPFGPRTCELGRYVGVRKNGRLLAMGGERFHLPGFVEISAVCVHPRSRGAGLGSAILLHLASEIRSRGKIPFLHVFPDNPARGLYESLGFRERARLWVIWRRPIAKEIG